ncbi:MAG TPA: hypothetical protein DET40_12530 [Lentisphaeria bacterium]|nr:MAG: hypothetical protein A2X45_00515 [Lentisphaerae bacterium GWF2_50_93]HCE44365.1 hypothetical protein [Lentisphaeria bacterium]
MTACTDWFRDAKWGVFTHYLDSPASHSKPSPTDADTWNRRVDSFDVKAFAGQLESVGARYYFITLGQNSGHYCAPNSTYDSIVGRHPSLCSKRDLILDLHAALAPKGIRLMAYLSNSAPQQDALAVERLEQKLGNYRNVEFQRKWEAVIREWSLRWGSKVSGYWIDGCYHADAMYRHVEAPNWGSFAGALKAGNPDSIVAFNPGVKIPVIRHCEYDDYTAGELTGDLPLGTCGGEGKWPYGPIQRFVDGAQYHVLNFLGDWWGQGEPRFPDELVAGYTRYINLQEGVVTWDVPISGEGRLPEAFLSQLGKLG